MNCARSEGEAFVREAGRGYRNNAIVRECFAKRIGNTLSRGPLKRNHALVLHGGPEERVKEGRMRTGALADSVFPTRGSVRKGADMGAGQARGKDSAAAARQGLHRGRISCYNIKRFFA